MAKKFVAFLDILGFKDLVENNTSEELVKIYTDSLKSIYDKGLGFWEHTYEFNSDEEKIKSIVISDSIILWGENDSLDTFFKLCATLKVFIAAAFRNGIPLRGVLEYNDLIDLKPTNISNHVLDNTIVLLGKSITHAYQLEQKQNWAGCILTQNSIQRILSIVKELKEVKEADYVDIDFMANSINLLIEYPVPLKSGPIVKYYCIDWLSLDSKLNEDAIRFSFKMHNKSTNNWDVEAKIKNTIDFYNYVKEHRKESNGSHRFSVNK